MAVDPSIEAAVREAVKATRSRRSVFKPGQVASVSTDQQTARVYVDGDALMTDDGGNDDLTLDGTTTCQILAPSGILAGDRVMILFAPPNGAYVVGRFAGDNNPWLIMGQDTPFISPWGWAPTVGQPWQPNTNQIPSLKRIGRIVELRGRAARASGGAPNPDHITTLPVGYRPANDVIMPVVVGSIAGLGFVIIKNTGELQAFLTAGTTDSTVGGYITFDGVMFSADPQ